MRASDLFARSLKQQNAVVIVNVSNIGACLSSSSVGVYSGRQHALEIFISALRAEPKG